MSNRPSKRLIGILALVLVVQIIAGGVLIYGRHGALQEVRSELEAKRLEREEARRVAVLLEEAARGLRGDQELLATLEVGVTEADYVPTLLRDLESLALVTSSHLASLRPERREEDAERRPTARQQQIDEQMGEDPEDPAEGPVVRAAYQILPIRMSLVGEYPDVQEFLRRLTRFPKIIGVDNVNVNPVSQGAEAGVGRNLLEVELMLRAYILDEREFPAAPAAEEEGTAL